MLGRSRADSNIGSAVKHHATEFAEVPSTPRKLARTQSGTTNGPANTSASSSRQHSITPSKSRSLENISSPPVTVPVRPALTSSNVRTYAGKSRSFLVALPTSQLGSLSRTGSMSQGIDDADTDNILSQSQEDDLEVRESYTALRMRWGVDNSDDFQPIILDSVSPGEGSRRKGKARQVDLEPVSLPSNMMNDLRSITELRSKGESRRFLDEIGYLFEGLEASGAIGVRRASALEIVTKFCDVEFARKAKAADFLGRMWEVLRAAGAGNGDKVLDTILIVFAALVARDPRDLADLASKSDFASVLYHMLDSLERTNDPLWSISCELSDAELRRIGIAKVEKTHLAGIHRLVRKKSSLLEDADSVSNRLLISRSLVVLPPSMHGRKHLPVLLKSLSSELAPLPVRITAYASGLSILPPSTDRDLPSLQHIDDCLRLLDSFLLDRWSVEEDDNDLSPAAQLDIQRQAGLGEALMALCITCDILSRDTPHHESQHIAEQCMETTLRVLINLTHDDLEWCRAVLSEPSAVLTIVRIIVMCQRQRTEATLEKDPDADKELAGDDGSAPSLDRLCLALGLLTNLVQVAHEAKPLTRDTVLAFNCTGKRGCINACQCMSSVTALECLALVYVQHCKSEDHMDIVVRGHMAVLIGLLMEESLENQGILLDSLPGPSRRQKLSVLIANATEFTRFYVEFTKRVSAALNSREGDQDEHERLETHPGDGSADKVLRDTKGETVAKNVIAFLESLRDHRSR
ncbi:hypothetical protein OBBRIDRAFT_725065 [Obba rivulosa]|uniref:Wings apart-like protein C-terminal domain-containing protein n=1 Tax=Obba rivulosa TaxID=1052685 RepID=A0A8E2DPE2_9APHY|nr:hypothetical protein OBBRIDRAFT_725065 [Obba rivulosa]